MTKYQSRMLRHQCSMRKYRCLGLCGISHGGRPRSAIVPQRQPRGIGRPFRDIVFLFLVAVCLLDGIVLAQQATDQVGQNVALGMPYTLHPQPGYRLCTDPDDTKQLTDGMTTSNYFWTQKGTVGWQSVTYATVTIDLGGIEPIGGVAMTTAAGVAGVTWPAAVYVLVSDDGKEYFLAGDLVALDHAKNGPWTEGYAIRRLVTDQLRTRGRYVQLVIVPRPAAPYLFTDEVEVIRGPASLLEPGLDRGKPTTVQSLYETGRLQRSVRHRWEADVAGLQKLISDAELQDATRTSLLEKLTAARTLGPDTIRADASFRAILPMGKHHAELFKVQAALWRTMHREALSVWVPVAWDPLKLFTVPPDKRPGSIEIHTMRGEYRSAALNLANSTDKPIEIQLRFDGLPQSPTPDYVTLHEVPWTDTAQGVPVAAALPQAHRVNGGWTVTVLPGLVRQVWMTFHVVDEEAARHTGAVVVESPGHEPRRIPVELRVWPLDFPQHPTLWLGGWSYLNGGGTRGVTSQNYAAFLAHLKEHFVSAPWASSSVLRSYEFDNEDPTRIHLETQQLDDWISAWPDAKAYLVFLSVAHYSGAIQTSLGGAKIGSAEFNQRVGTWISAWVRHLRSKGITPDRLGLLIHDEPHEGSDISPLLTWARAIQAAEPDVIVWEDPTYRDPAAAPAELFEVCDILCPNRPMWLERGEPFATFYRNQQQRGRTLQFYSCSGPAKLLDPYSYYRLQAWQCWQAGATGSFFWAFGDNSGASSWNEYLAKAGPFTPLFLDDTSVTPGKHMEAIRESVEDYEYFVMLKCAIEKAKKEGRADRAIVRAEEILQTAAETVLSAKGASQLRWHESKDRTIADQMRVKMLEIGAAVIAGNRNEKGR
jgi:hypothetical protein